MNKWNLKLYITKKHLLFILLFALIALIAQQINFSKVIGAEQQYFTFFQFIGPIAGSFLGPIFGIAAIFAAQLSDLFIAGKAFSFINIFRLFPMLFAAYYFGTKKKHLSIVVPAICMALFWVHPIGAQAWFYALYWLIPIGIALFLKKNLFFKSLGATFTAHAIGSTIWLYTIPMTTQQWMMLMPVVAYERLFFALGISVSFVVFTTVLHKLENALPKGVLNIEAKYVLSKNFLKA